jgi:hypothetical protein
VTALTDKQAIQGKEQNASSPMACVEACSRMVLMWAGDVVISDDEQAAFYEHLRTCSACRAEYVQTQQAIESQDITCGPDVDINVIQQVAEGDRKAFEGLYLHYWPLLLHFICKQHPLLGEHIAEDVASEPLARIW